MTFERTLRGSAAGFAIIAGLTTAALAEEITIATVNNADMITMQELAPQWEEATGNKINWVVLEENVLRQRTTTDIATNGGSFDVMFIGAYETPIWGAKGWLTPLDDFADDADYDLEDIFQLVRNGLSADGHLYAVPLYSETSFTFYRTDLFEKAGIAAPTEQPTYTEFAEMAAKLVRGGLSGGILMGRRVMCGRSVLLFRGGCSFDESDCGVGRRCKCELRGNRQHRTNVSMVEGRMKGERMCEGAYVCVCVRVCVRVCVCVCV